MVTFVYRCPNTGYDVQGFVANDIPDEEAKGPRVTRCIVCNRFHLVNPQTGKVTEERPH